MHTTTTRRSAVRALTSAAAAAAVALALTACGGGSSAGSAATSAPTTAGMTTSAAMTSAPAAQGVSLENGWIKVGAKGGMTAVFGTLRNSGAAPVTVTGGSSDAAMKVELHEVVMKDGQMKMQPKAGGFALPAGGTHVLEPGHDHIMVMGLAKDLVAGDMVKVSLTLSDGTTVALDVVAKDFTGANETYAPTASMTSGM